ncbi:MAG: peptidoglycan editing factor PgeF [Pseudomonadota bacterium]|nr:peptidoglycan editing factor PgeF [Pseudomonadota bacterium]MDE3037259.1 peptidoglycan editing factor PgeF [Pseudomonadota bacterium]
MHRAPQPSEAGGLLALTAPPLALPGIRHGFFTRNGGVSEGIYASLNCGYGSGDNQKKVAENRARVAKTFGETGDRLLTAFQVHGARAVIVTEPWRRENAPEADALATKTPGVILGILTADCLPILFADAGHKVIAAAHAGWKGASGGVIEAAVDAMLQLGAARSAIVAAIGPGIAQGSYEVDSLFRDRFLMEDERNRMYFVHGARDGHFLFDLKAYAGGRLKEAGIAPINVLADDTCLQENAFFSYRRATLRSESAYGRQVSAIALSENRASRSRYAIPPLSSA